MRTIFPILIVGLALMTTSCIVWIAEPVSSYEWESWVNVESNTEWVGEIDGWPIHGYGDRTYYTDAYCANVENITCCGFIRLTICHEDSWPVTSYSNSAYGSVWVCE